MTTRDEFCIQFLSRNPMCRTLTDAEIETFLEFTDTIEKQKGDVIADIGEVGEALLMVVQGEVALISDDGKQQVEMGRGKSGQLVGEMSFFDRKPRMLRMQATQNDTTLLRLTRAMYKRLRVEHPYIAVNLLEYAIISLDDYFRSLSKETSHYANFLYAPGRK